MARKRLTNGQKLQIVRDCEQRLANNESLRSIARSYGLQGKQIRNWRDKQLLLANTKSTKKSTSHGAKGRLQEYEWVSENWEAITEVTIRNAWRKSATSQKRSESYSYVVSHYLDSVLLP
ncbi:CENP-B N-terminal DNA-binding domain containing protein [Nitzschia inconspicua]|uniref:CENP-B N-terminal DNA-binding domain containing protein n=1 Tax=Nitzschia inconspicua TaxID=303405 RepID=A0A9K3KFX9_9STRA|nr:CENP-B N-terminal DNA-binding domain containing protein [Nitzschia inconspicua]